ncbi:MAG TPA: hypothetical protein VF368_03600 [Gemmatimonadaceae bacterium]|jgi:hypothetical protein
MRPKLLVSSCLLAVVFLVVALRGPWGSAMADDGTRFDISLHGISHVLHPTVPRSDRKDCAYLTGKGAVEFCTPSSESDAPYSMLCSAFPMILSGLVLAFASGLVSYVSPYGARGTAATLSAASLAAVFIGTVVAQISMPRAFRILDEIPLQMGGFAFRSIWIAMGFLLFAAALSTTSTMLRHT